MKWLLMLTFISPVFGKQVIDIGKNTVDGKGHGHGLNLIESTTLKPEMAVRYLKDKIQEIEKRVLNPRKRGK